MSAALTVLRLTRASEVLMEWELFDAGFQYLAAEKELYYEILQMKKFVCKLATEHASGYVSVAYADDGTTLGFTLFQENTFPFATYRTFQLRAVYYKNGHSAAILSLLGDFEQWCREQRIRRYSFTSRRPTHIAKRTFGSEKFGFTRLALTFEKTL